ncbi:mms19 nucleotide excision repair [Lobulomyces angularis]|nr:mms19 nucleotide excision repair [Lobulomyces angularis]
MNEENVTSLVKKFFNLTTESTDSIEIIDQITIAINNGTINFLRLVNSLEPSLTSQDPFVRSKGLGLLSSVIEKTDALSKAEGKVLLSYFLEKLYDQPSVAEILKGIREILKHTVVEQNQMLDILKSIFAELSVQSFQQSVRLLVYEIFEIILVENANFIKMNMNDDFIFGYITVMEGEKDPRNLIKAFKIVKLISSNFDFTKFAEDLFDVFFCYFPITFKPPKNDPNAISAEDLKCFLKECVSASPLFSPYALPLLLEKISSTSIGAKMDAIDAFIACLKVYDASDLIPHIEELWVHLKDSIFNSTNDDCEQLALAAVKSISAALSTVPVIKQEDSSKKFLNLILTECLKNLTLPESILAKQSGKVLASVARASEPTCNYVCAEVVPKLLTDFSDIRVVTGKKNSLQVLVDLVESARLIYGSVNNDEQEDTFNPILPYKDRLFELFGKSLSDNYIPLNIVAIMGLSEFLLTSQLLGGPEQTSMGIRMISNTIITSKMQQEGDNEELEDVESTALEALVKFGIHRPEILLEITIPDLFEILPEKLTDFENAILTFDNIINALEKISEISVLFEIIVSKLMEKLIRLNESKINEASASTEETERKLENYYLRILDSIYKSVQKFSYNISNEAEVNAIKSVSNSLFLRLINLSGIQNDKNTFDNIKVIRKTAKLLIELNAHLERNVRDEIVNTSFDHFTNQDSNSSFFVHFNVNTTSDTSLVLAAAVAACPPDQNLPMDAKSLVQKLFQLNLRTKNTTLNLSIAILISNFVNKNINCLDLLLLKDLENIIFCSSQEFFKRKNCLTVYTWVAKGLVISSNNLGYEIVDNLIRLLNISSNDDDIKISVLASHSFSSILVDDETGFLTKKSRAFVKSVYRQKFFKFVKGPLLNGFKGSKGSEVSMCNFLTSISNVIQKIPRSLLLKELPSLFPVLLSCLNYPDGELKLSTLRILKQISTSSKEFFEDHIGTIVPLLLDLSSFKNISIGNTMLVRVLSLDILGDLTNSISFPVVFPYKPLVLKTLKDTKGSYIDDPKKLVRKSAVNTRNKWFLFTGPKD